MTSRLQQSAGDSRFRTASLSLQGRRNSNQDRICLVPPDSPTDFLIAAIADGLGGMRDGDKAAQIAIDTVSETADELNRSMLQSFNAASDVLLDLYERANNRIRKHAEVSSNRGAVGTTLTTLILSGSQYLVAHIGDSRCYLIDDSEVSRLTSDHTLADELLRQGSLSEKDYNSSPFRNQLTRSLGPQELCEVEIVPEFEFGKLDSNVTFLLCSDGFYASLGDADFSRLHAPASDIQKILKSLASEALDRGSSDNLSAIAVQRLST